MQFRGQMVVGIEIYNKKYMLKIWSTRVVKAIRSKC